MKNVVLVADLSKKEHSRFELSPEDTQSILGGSGVGWKLAAQYLKPGIEPLSPENVIVLSVGVLTGTPAPGASKLNAITKFPIIASEDGKHFIGECTGGGRRFGPMLKMAGIDHLVILGRADQPVYLKIIDDNVEFVDAHELWGRTSEETADRLITEIGDDCGVVAIGQAGENQVLYSLAFIDKTNSLGRSGLGAVMGSKNLKAIAVKGTKGIEVADPDAFERVVGQMSKAIVNWPKREHWISIGMGAGWSTFIHTQYPGKWSKQEWDELYGEERRLETLDRVVGCNSCLIACRVRWKIRDGEFAGEVGLGSPYGKSATSGQLLDIRDHRKAIHLVTLANAYGIDFYTTTRLMDYVTTLYQQGRLKLEDTQGLELNREYETYLKLLEMIVNREGFGDALADGWLGLYQRYGIHPQDYWYGGISKGVDFIYDGRASNFHPMMMSFFTRPRPHHGGSHTLTNSPGNTLEVLRAQVEALELPSEIVDRIFTPAPHTGEFNIGRYTMYMEDWMRVKNALGFCSVYTFFGIMSGKEMAEVYSAATGVKMSGYDLMKAGERISNLAKQLNAKEGFSREDDQVPEIWLKPMDTPEGRIEMQDYFKTKTMTREDIDRILDDYYEERGWDKKKGIPTKKKMIELGIQPEA
jgi:aldehyde:ferredoxin oxidoreductase